MINRDGNCISLWQDMSTAYIPLNLPNKEFLYDVIIVGGGITGITAGLLLQEAGKKCLVLEAANICYGTTGGTTAHLNTLLDTPYNVIAQKFGKENAKLVAKAAKEAVEFIRSNVEVYNIDCGFEDADAFLFAQDDKQIDTLKEIHDASLEAGLTLQYENKIPVPVPFKKAMCVKGQAKFSPVQYVHAIAKAFEKAGGIIVENHRVTGAQEKEYIEVQTPGGTFKSRALIYATHIPTGVNILHLRCIPYRTYAMAMSLKNMEYPENLSYDLYDPYHYYRTQTINGKSYLIVGGNDHKTAHEENTEKCFLELEGYLRNYFDIDEIHYKWSSQYYEPADGLPYIGHLPGHPGNIYVATGFGGNGMTYSNIAALLFRKMLLKEKSEYEELFDPNRIKPIAGFTNFISHNADTIKQFVGRLFSGEDLKEFADIAPGEGRMVKYKDEKIALYKDDNGELHAVNPVCTHLKCEIKWNQAERSWDCPCHGARYSIDGVVLNAPSDRPLEKIELRQLSKKD